MDLERALQRHTQHGHIAHKIQHFVAYEFIGAAQLPKSQWEASAGQGMTPRQQYRYVIFPQAARLMTPPLVNQAISTFKETTLASIISLPELTFQSLEIMAVTRMTFELWLTTATLYLLISYTWSGLGRRLEQSRRWRPLE